MNPKVLEGWISSEGTKMTIDLIMEWVSVWEQAPSAPQFKATSNVKRADIRVNLSGVVYHSMVKLSCINTHSHR